MADVVHILNNPGSLLKAIREIVKDSANVSFGPAFEKGIAGNVSMSQIWKCLEEGHLTNTPISNQYGDYLCELNVATAGQDIYLTIAVDTKSLANRTITVLHISEG